MGLLKLVQYVDCFKQMWDIFERDKIDFGYYVLCYNSFFLRKKSVILKKEFKISL